jgi:hypothetical protein
MAATQNFGALPASFSKGGATLCGGTEIDTRRRCREYQRARNPLRLDMLIFKRRQATIRRDSDGRRNSTGKFVNNMARIEDLAEADKSENRKQ